MALDRVHHLRMPREFLVRGIADVVALGPVAHRREVDVDESGAFAALVAKNHSLKDVGEELELVLHIFRRKEAPIGHLAHVLGAVDDAQVARALLDKARIARGDPAFGIFGVCGAFGVLVVFHKNTRRAVEDFAIVRDFQLHAGAGHAHGITAHLAIGLGGDEHRRLGLAVELFEVDAERTVEVENLRPDRLARRIANTHAAEPERVFQRAIDHQLTKRIFRTVHERHLLAVQNRRPNLAGMGHEGIEQPFLEAARVFHTDHNAGQLRLEHTRRSEVIGRPDLAQIDMHGVGAFRAVGAEPGPERLAHGEDEIPNPCHRQIGEDLVRATQIVEL